MLFLTNEQRKFFAIPPIEDNWKRIEFDGETNYRAPKKIFAYVDGNNIKKVVETGEKWYNEYGVDERVSDDFKFILPKTAKGSPKPLRSSTFEKITPHGVGLFFSSEDSKSFVLIDSCDTQQYYYCSRSETDDLFGLSFEEWVKMWCEQSTKEDIDDIYAFSKMERKHVKYREGDFFRFKIGRRSYGYGRILKDYSLMRKNKTPFWDVFMGKPLIVAVYHIITERKDVSSSELIGKMMLPAQHIMDNVFYYGECEIFDNRPIEWNETEYPINYGEGLELRQPPNRPIYFQCGPVFKKIDGGELLFPDVNLRNGAIGFSLNVKKSVLEKCILENSNAPYWDSIHPKWRREDLRAPENADKLKAVKKQFGIE